jgi:FKBP-type peptidyl-prolyl cis-trans isomerase
MPPAIAYGDQTLRDSMGNILIPAGSILIFELVLNSVN